MTTRPLVAPALGLALAVTAAMARPARLDAQIQCHVLRTADQAYAGRCVMNARTIALLVLRPPENGGAGRWEGTRARVFGERGDSTQDVVDWSAFGPDLVDTGRDSLFAQCWCKVTRFSLDRDGLRFEADPDRRAPPTATDLQVLQRLRRTFSDSTRWNRHSERSRGVFPCPRDSSTRTLYCAMQEAETALRGEFYLATPAAAAIREAIQEVAPTARYQHPLDGFNNDPAVPFTDFQRMLEVALRRIQDAMERRRTGSAGRDGGDPGLIGEHGAVVHPRLAGEAPTLRPGPPSPAEPGRMGRLILDPGAGAIRPGSRTGRSVRQDPPQRGGER